MSNKIENLTPFVKEITKPAKDLLEKFFPGALTIILEKSKKTPLYITSNKNTVGIRIPNNEFFAQLCSVIDGGVLATTSANLSNEPSSKTFEEAKNSIGHLVDYVFEDYGYECKGLESTVVLATNEEIKVLRQGAIDIHS